MKRNIYLDYAAATRLDHRVLLKMQPYLESQFYNPSAIYLKARAVREDINKARQKIAEILGARPAEIIFTSGATEANNLAIAGIMKANPKGQVLVSAIEHESVLAPAKLFPHKLVGVSKQGVIDMADLQKKLSKKTVLVSIMLVNNEIGSIQPLGEVAKLIAAERKARLKAGNKMPIYLHSDLAQAGNYLDIHVSRLGVDLATINGGKIYGPKQTGVLYVRAGVKLTPLIVGGGQEFGMRSGTENIPGIIGLAEALDITTALKPFEAKRLTGLRDHLESRLMSKFDAASINGSSKHKAPHIVSLTLPGTDNERLMMELDEAGIQLAVGSACSASSDEPSHVLKALGLSNKDARATLRISLGRQTTKKQLDKFVDTLGKILKV